MPALSSSQRGRLVRAALAEEVEDMGQLADTEQTAQPGVAGLRAALRKNAAYLAAVQTPLLDHALQLTRKQEAEAVAAALAGWGFAGRSREQLMDEALNVSSIMLCPRTLWQIPPIWGFGQHQPDPDPDHELGGTSVRLPASGLPVCAACVAAGR